jgi:hypothetical protein
MLVTFWFAEVTIFDMDKGQSFNQLEKHPDIVKICLLLAACCVLRVVCCLLFVVCCLLVVDVDVDVDIDIDWKFW